MKRTLLAALFASAAMLSFAEIIQYEGVYYDVTKNGTTGNGRVVAPPEGNYSGDIAVYSSFTLDGVTYSISSSISTSQGFNSPTIKNFTCGFNPEDFGGRSYNISLRYNKGLESIKFLYLENPVKEDGYTVFNNVNLGSYNTDCIKVTMRKNGDENLLAVEKFNVYGPDGKLLKPRLMVDGTGELITPDENNVFHLDSEWMYKGQYCIVLPLSSADYTVVGLYGVSEDNKVASVRVEPLKGETGVYTQTNGITYSINGDHAELGTNKNSETTGDAVIPEYVELDGRQYPVTTIHPDAFAGSEITSVTVPSTVTDLADYAFEGCSKLEFADLSKTNVSRLAGTFRHCESLREVKLPQPAKASVSAKATEGEQTPLTLDNTFYNCAAFESIRLPHGTVLRAPFTGSGVADFEVAEINENKVAFRCNKFNIFDENGQALPFKLYVEQRNSGEDNPIIHTPTFVNGLYEFKYEDFLYTAYNGSQQFNGNIYCDFDETVSDAIGGGSYLSLYVDKKDFSGVNDVVVDENVPAMYYNLQGIPVPADNLTPGIYIERRGNKATKVLIK